MTTPSYDDYSSTITDPAPPDERPAQGHRNLRITLLVVGSLLLAYLLIGGATRVAYALNAPTSRTPVAAVVTEPFSAVTVDASASSITVRFAAVRAARIDFDPGASDLRLKHSVDGGTLHVAVKTPGPGWLRWGPFDFGWGHAAVTVILPEAQRGAGLKLDVDSTAGNIDVDGDFGAVTVGSTAGDVTLRGRAADLALDSTSGDVTLKNFTVDGALTSSSTAGNTAFDLATLPQRIEADSTAGDIRVTLPRGLYRIETDTTAGNVSVNVPSDPAAERTYRFSTTAGDIDLSLR